MSYLVSKKSLPTYSVAAMAFGLMMVTGCSVIRDMSDMHNSTAAMSNTTADLDNQTKKMQGTTEDVDQSSHATYRDIRQGNSLDLRNKAIKDMEAAPDEEDKLLQAASYFQAFEYQLFQDVNDDTLSEYDELKSEAVQELFLRIHKYLPKNPASYSLSPSSSKPAMMNLYAIVTTLDRINPQLQLAANAKGFEPVSMLQILEQGLAMKAQINSGMVSESEEPLWASQVLQNEQDAVYLLRLRANFMPALVLAKISDISYTNLLKVFVTMILKDWSPDVSGQNKDQLEEYSTFLQSANEARDFLTSTPSESPYAVKIDKNLMKVYRNMRPIEGDSAAAVNPDVRQKALGDLQAEIDTFRKQ